MQTARTSPLRTSRRTSAQIDIPGRSTSRTLDRRIRGGDRSTVLRGRVEHQGKGEVCQAELFGGGVVDPQRVRAGGVERWFASSDDGRDVITKSGQ